MDLCTGSGGGQVVCLVVRCINLLLSGVRAPFSCHPLLLGFVSGLLPYASLRFDKLIR